MNLFEKISKLENLSYGLRKLYYHKVGRDFALSFVSFFGPLLVFSLSGSLQIVLLYYAAISLVLIFLLPLAKYTLHKKPLNFFLFLGTFGAVIYYILFSFLSSAGYINWWIIGAMVIVCAFLKFFYWVPFHVEFASFIDKHHKGRQLSFLSILVSLVNIVTPVISGWMIYRFGWTALFCLAILLLLVSMLPIRKIPKVYESYKFGYLETFKKVISKKHLKTNLAYAADGFQSRIGYIVWPVVIFQIVDGSWLKTGIISTVIILASTVLKYIAGEESDKHDKKKMIHKGTFLTAISWVFKALAVSAWQIFAVGVFHDLVGIFLRTPFDSTTYDIAADQGHYVDEFSVLREISIHTGGIMAGVLGALLLFWLSPVWVFVLAALATLLMNFISEEEFYIAHTRRVGVR